MRPKFNFKRKLKRPRNTRKKPKPEDEKKSYNILKINAMISIVAIFVTALLTHQLPKSNELETRKYELNREAITIVLNDIMPFSNYYNVDWDSIAKMSYVKYSGCSLTYEDM